MTKQPEALRIADVLIGSSQFTGTPIWQAADMLHRQHAEITALRNALEQPAVETEKTSTKESNADLDFCSNAAINEQRRNMVREVEVGRSLGNGQNQSTGNSEPQGAVAVITGFDEYGPFLDWHTHWVNLPVGARLYAAPQAQQPVVEPDNLKCKSVQKRLATLWGYVEAQQPVQCKHCTKFSSQYRCNASQGECDCPKCQGFCTCSQQPQLLTDELAACHKDAARYQWLVEYFVGDRTDLDDAIVGASEIGVEQVTAVIDAAMESK